MNAPFQVAQLTTGQSSAAQPKIISLTKPAEGQSVTVKIEGAVKLDFTAISSEKITLVHGVAPVAERLTILFDNKSIVIVEPFFDSSGKPLHTVSGIELEPGRVVSAEEFAQIFPMTDNQDVLAGAGNAGAPAKSSGGEFAGPTVDGLPDFAALPLLGPEELGNWNSEIPRNPEQTAEPAAPPAPLLLAPDDNDVTVEEAAMDKFTTAPDLAHGTVTGSLPGSTAETDASNQLDGSGGVGTLTYQLVTGGNNPTAGTYGTIQVNPDGSYIYTLTSPFHSSPDANDGHNIEGAESFTYQVTDSDGHTATGTITVNIVDDVPTATADTGDVNEGALLEVAAVDGVLKNDEQGADGATVVGVRAEGGDSTTDVTTGVGTDIAGEHGTLTLYADGSYKYQSDANDITDDTTDVFVYTIKDGDGDLSTTTLTINLTDGTVLAPADDDVTVEEAALDTTTTGDDLTHGTITGSLGTSSAAETDSSNQLNGSGGFGTLTYELVTGGNDPTAGTYGTIQVNSDGSYTYTLTSPFTTSPEADDGANTEVAESFTYRVTDENGNTQTGTITVNIVDDVPTATADTNDVNEGALLEVAAIDGVLSNDEKGADGATIVGVRASGGDDTTDVSGGVATAIVGEHGTLTLYADGSYKYQSDANDITDDTTDVFVYTLKDGDGDLSTTTLTINLTDSGLVAGDDDEVTVYEKALDNTTTGSDVAHGTITGSLGTSSALETDASNTLVGNVTGGFGTLTYELVTGGNDPTAGTYGTIQVNSNGTYVYTLTSPYDTSPDANNGANTEQNRDSFTYKVTDGNGNTSTGTIYVDIVDDTPTATVDTGNVNEGALLTVNAASGVLSNDVAGADGFAAGGGVVGVRAAGGDTTTAVTTGVNTSIVGEHGTLTLQANGSYTYQSDANDITSNTTDVFVYTIKDGDGDLSTTTLTINLTDVTVVAPDDSDVTVYESALDTTTTGNDLAHGTITGSLGTSSALETDASNQLNGSGGVGALTYELVTGGNNATAGTYGTIQVNSDGSYTYTLTSPFDTSPDANNGNNTEVAESFTYKAIDSLGNFTTGTITVNIVDDVPSAVVTDHAIVQNGNTSPLTLDLDIDDSVVNNYGADTAGTVRFAASLDGANSGLTSSGIPITYDVSPDGLTLTATAGANTIFTVVLDPATSHYTIDMNGTVDATTQVDFFGESYAFSGGNTGWVGLLQTGGNQDVLLTPFGTGGDTINGSAVAVGVGGGNKIGAGEGMRLDFVTNLTGDPGPSSKGYHDVPPTYQDHVYDDHYVTNGASVTFGAGHNNTTVQLNARDDADGNDAIGDGTYDSVTSITIKYGDLTQVVTFGGPGGIGTTDTAFIIGDRTYNVHFVDADPGAGVNYGVQVTGILDDTVSIATFTSDSYNSLEVYNVSGDEFNITGFGSAVPTTNPTDFNLPIEVVDGDGDVANSYIDVTVVSGAGVQDHSNDLVGDPHAYTSTVAQPHIIGSDFADTITGDSAKNVIWGGGGNDTINGGAGADILIGGAGNDAINTGAANDDLQDVIRYENVADFGDTVTNFDANGTDATDDKIVFGGALNAEFDDVVDDDDFAWASGDNGAGTVNADLSTVEALYLSGSAAEGVPNASLTNATDVAAAFNAEFNITAAAGQDALLVINDNDANSSSVWRYVESTGGGEISAAELTLVGTFQANAAVTTGNLDLAN